MVTSIFARRTRSDLVLAICNKLFSRYIHKLTDKKNKKFLFLKNLTAPSPYERLSKKFKPEIQHIDATS
jgi:hypothetical protein